MRVLQRTLDRIPNGFVLLNHDTEWFPVVKKNIDAVLQALAVILAHKRNPKGEI
jgi:hypothetical protein